MTTQPPAAPRRKRIYCNRCKLETNHFAHCSYSRRDAEEDGYWEEMTYALWACAGCDAGTLETAMTSVALRDGEEQIYDITFFPPRASADLPHKIFRKLPRPLRSIYRETVDAYNQQLNLLCAGGLRALIEGICGDKGIKGKNLEARIDGLTGLLPKNIVDHLHAFRFIGNEALHELAIPKRPDLRMAIEVSEDLLNFLYELDYKASQLPKKQKPPEGGVS